MFTNPAADCQFRRAHESVTPKAGSQLGGSDAQTEFQCVTGEARHVMVFWQGRGIFIVGIFFAACLAAVPCTLYVIAPALGLAHDADHRVYLVIAVAALASAIATYPLGGFNQRSNQDPTAIDKSGSNVLRSADRLFFIDIRYWPFLFFALSLAMLAITFF
jgi:hypothetical protein